MAVANSATVLLDTAVVVLALLLTQPWGQRVRLVARSDSLLFPSAVRSLAAEYGRRRPAPPWAARLTEREGEVLRLMTTGLTNAEIAGHMGVGPSTTKTHVASVLAKTGVRDRTQAVIAAYESGFVSPR